MYDFLMSYVYFHSVFSSVFATIAGHSEGVRMCLRALLTNSGGKRGVLTPIPQYPLYTASIHLYDGHTCGYYLDETNVWGMQVKELERALAQARSQGIEVVAMVFINPGNPTGQCLSPQNVKDIIHFCIREKLVLFADEVCTLFLPPSSFQLFLSQLSSYPLTGS